MDVLCTCATEGSQPLREVMEYLPSSLRGIPTSATPLEVLSFPSSGVGLDLLLQSVHWVSFDHLLRRFGSNLHFFAKNIPHSCLRGWLCASLDSAESWKCEDTCFLRLLASDLHQGVEVIRARLLLQTMLLCQRLCNHAFRHWLGRSCLGRTLGLHTRSHDNLGSELEKKEQIYKC